MEWAGLRIGWELLPSPPDRIRVHAVVANRSSRFVARELPYCVIRVRLYREGELIWDQGAGEACFGLRRVRLSPGEEADFRSTVTAGEVLGPHTRPGDFVVRVHLPSSRRPGLPPRAEMELTLGETTLKES